LISFLPNGDELFPNRDATIEDLRSLQDNPVYQNIVQRLRSAAYTFAMTKDEAAAGVARSLEIMGLCEFEIQKDDEEAKAPREGTTLASDIGFEEDQP
jgi:hypothetical protein